MLLVSLSVDMRNWIYSKRKRFQRQIVEIYCLVLIFDAKVLNYVKRIYIQNVPKTFADVTFCSFWYIFVDIYCFFRGKSGIY